MHKVDMREWVLALEEMIDHKLKKWRKDTKIENGEVVHLRWQFEQTHFHVDVFWESGNELVALKFLSPRVIQTFHWHGLNSKTFNRITDRIGNLAQAVHSPPIDPDDD
jgi:hypothetical protein